MNVNFAQQLQDEDITRLKTEIGMLRTSQRAMQKTRHTRHLNGHVLKLTVDNIINRYTVNSAVDRAAEKEVQLNSAVRQNQSLRESLREAYLQSQSELGELQAADLGVENTDMEVHTGISESDLNTVGVHTNIHLESDETKTAFLERAVSACMHNTWYADKPTKLEGKQRYNVLDITMYNANGEVVPVVLPPKTRFAMSMLLKELNIKHGDSGVRTYRLSALLNMSVLNEIAENGLTGQVTIANNTVLIARDLYVKLTNEYFTSLMDHSIRGGIAASEKELVKAFQNSSLVVNTDELECKVPFRFKTQSIISKYTSLVASPKEALCAFLGTGQGKTRIMTDVLNGWGPLHDVVVAVMPKKQQLINFMQEDLSFYMQGVCCSWLRQKCSQGSDGMYELAKTTDLWKMFEDEPWLTTLYVEYECIGGVVTAKGVGMEDVFGQTHDVSDTSIRYKSSRTPTQLIVRRTGEQLSEVMLEGNKKREVLTRGAVRVARKEGHAFEMCLKLLNKIRGSVLQYASDWDKDAADDLPDHPQSHVFIQELKSMMTNMISDAKTEEYMTWDKRVRANVVDEETQTAWTCNEPLANISIWDDAKNGEEHVPGMVLFYKLFLSNQHDALDQNGDIWHANIVHTAALLVHFRYGRDNEDLELYINNIYDQHTFKAIDCQVNSDRIKIPKVHIVSQYIFSKSIVYPTGFRNPKSTRRLPYVISVYAKEPDAHTFKGMVPVLENRDDQHEILLPMYYTAESLKARKVLYIVDEAHICMQQPMWTGDDGNVANMTGGTVPVDTKHWPSSVCINALMEQGETRRYGIVCVTATVPTTKEELQVYKRALRLNDSDNLPNLYHIAVESAIYPKTTICPPKVHVPIVDRNSGMTLVFAISTPPSPNDRLAVNFYDAVLHEYASFVNVTVDAQNVLDKAACENRLMNYRRSKREQIATSPSNVYSLLSEREWQEKLVIECLEQQKQSPQPQRGGKSFRCDASGSKTELPGLNLNFACKELWEMAGLDGRVFTTKKDQNNFFFKTMQASNIQLFPNTKSGPDFQAMFSVFPERQASYDERVRCIASSCFVNVFPCGFSSAISARIYYLILDTFVNTVNPPYAAVKNDKPDAKRKLCGMLDSGHYPLHPYTNTDTGARIEKSSYDRLSGQEKASYKKTPTGALAKVFGVCYKYVRDVPNVEDVTLLTMKTFAYISCTDTIRFMADEKVRRALLHDLLFELEEELEEDRAAFEMHMITLLKTTKDLLANAPYECLKEISGDKLELYPACKYKGFQVSYIEFAACKHECAATTTDIWDMQEVVTMMGPHLPHILAEAYDILEADKVGSIYPSKNLPPQCLKDDHLFQAASVIVKIALQSHTRIIVGTANPDLLGMYIGICDSSPGEHNNIKVVFFKEHTSFCTSPYNEPYSSILILNMHNEEEVVGFDCDGIEHVLFTSAPLAEYQQCMGRTYRACKQIEKYTVTTAVIAPKIYLYKRAKCMSMHDKSQSVVDILHPIFNRLYNSLIASNVFSQEHFAPLNIGQNDVQLQVAPCVPIVVYNHVDNKPDIYTGAKWYVNAHELYRTNSFGGIRGDLTFAPVTTRIEASITRYFHQRPRLVSVILVTPSYVQSNFDVSPDVSLWHTDELALCYVSAEDHRLHVIASRKGSAWNFERKLLHLQQNGGEVFFDDTGTVKWTADKGRQSCTSFEYCSTQDGSTVTMCRSAVLLYGESVGGLVHITAQDSTFCINVQNIQDASHMDKVIKSSRLRAWFPCYLAITRYGVYAGSRKNVHHRNPSDADYRGSNTASRLIRFLSV